jgi:hypothetical protein
MILHLPFVFWRLHFFVCPLTRTSTRQGNADQGMTPSVLTLNFCSSETSVISLILAAMRMPLHPLLAVFVLCPSTHASGEGRVVRRLYSICHDTDESSAWNEQEQLQTITRTSS